MPRIRMRRGSLLIFSPLKPLLLLSLFSSSSSILALEVQDRSVLRDEASDNGFTGLCRAIIRSVAAEELGQDLTERLLYAHSAQPRDLGDFLYECHFPTRARATFIE